MEPNLDLPRLSVKMRWVLLPIMFIWWAFQLTCFSTFGGVFCIIIGVGDIFEQIGTKKEDRDWNNSFTILSAPFVFPVVWWIRYWKFGEYNTLD